jgi:hypothetical protein
VPAPPRTDWLGHLVEKRRQAGESEPSPKSFAESARARREQADADVVALLRENLAPEAFDEARARDWLGRFGPLPADAVKVQLETRLALGEPTDRHVEHYLEEIRKTLHGDMP